MAEFIDTFKIADFRDHIVSKAMWAGAVTPIIIQDLLGLTSDNKLIEITNPHTPALLKSIDEIIVNAIDHCKGCEKNVPSKRVTKIIVKYINGKIIVYNNGPGIPLSKDKNGKYYIESAFSTFLAGTNIEKPIDSIKGGINGLGAKIANVHSNEFTVEIVSSRQKYIQIFKNRLSIIEKPIITKTTESEHTEITFIPAYIELGYTNDMAYYKNDIDMWLRLRMCQVTAYIGIEVMYNDILCTTTSSELLAKIISNENESVISTICKSNNGHMLYVSIIIPQEKTKRKSCIQNMTIVNGVVSTKGSHINYIRKTIKEYTDNKINKLTKGSHINDINIRLVVCGAIPNIDWSGQNKDQVQVSNKVLETYKIQDSFLKQISALLVGSIVVSQPIKEKIEHDKYIKARNINNNKLKKQCLLLAAEGDSAITLLRTGLTQKCNKKCDKSEFIPSFDWVGIISLQGVVINAAKEITGYETCEGSYNVRSEKLKNNKRLNMLADAFGLRYDYTYESQKELDTLHYGKLIICTDQDLDGIGKICSLVLVWIYTFWPHLIKAKRIGKLMTPVIRACKGNTLLEFYYETELDQWMNSINHNGYKIKYYKGLATHNEVEAENMFKLVNFNKNIYTYIFDELTIELFNIYFGPDPSLRKKILISPVKHLTYKESIELKQSQEIPVGKIQLDIDTKLYKNEAINRQLPHIIDGLNPARRKILTASILRFSQDSKEVKVFQLGGYVADKMLYHHGDMSLNKTIITMAQSFTNARRYPYLIGIGQFGSRHGDKAGSARYISVKLNPIVHLLFPPEDKWLLSYTFDEGIRAEPEYFVPILPMVVLESYQIVSEGWNHKTFGRSLEPVVNIVKEYIKTGLINKDTQLPICGDIRLYRGSEYSFGNYIYNSVKNIIYITDLPIGMITINYIEFLQKSIYIDHIEDYSSTNEVEINIFLKPNVMDIINSKYGDNIIDPIEDCFNLRTSLKSNLNYYSCDKGVLEYTNYINAIIYWAPIRKELYKLRLVRKEILLKIIIEKEDSIIRYIKMSNQLNISSLDDDNAIIVLEKHKFPRINSSLLSSPGYTKNEELEYLILQSENASYDYILDLRERDLTTTSLQKRQANLEKHKKEYNIIINYLQEQPFPGMSLWLQEIDKLIEKM
jgi:DNA topoisomerase-2